MNVGDTLSDAGLLIDNIAINGTLVNNGDFETGDLTGFSKFAGFQSIETAAIGSGPPGGDFQAFLTSSAISDNLIETILSLPGGTLDSLAAGTAIGGQSTDATDGAAIGRTVTVVAGDTLTFDFNFLQNEESPEFFFNDFAFVSLSASPTVAEVIADTNIATFPAGRQFPPRRRG